jgi:hypothetical protein
MGPHESEANVVVTVVSLPLLVEANLKDKYGYDSKQRCGYA